MGAVRGAPPSLTPVSVSLTGMGLSLLVETIHGDRPGYVTALLLFGVASATVAAWQVRHGDVLGWTMATGASVGTVACLLVAHTTGLPGLGGARWGTPSLAAVALGSVVVASAARVGVRCWRRPRTVDARG